MADNAMDQGPQFSGSTEQSETIPSPKRRKLDPSTPQTQEEESSSSSPSSTQSSSSLDDRPEHALDLALPDFPKDEHTFVLTDFLPENIAKPSLQKANEVENKLMESFKALFVVSQSFPNCLEQLNLTLPEKYSSPLENNSHLFCKLVQMSIAVLASKGVQTVKKVVLPSLEIQQFHVLLPELKMEAKMKLIEVPFKAQDKQQLLANLPAMIKSLCRCFSASHQINLCDPSEINAELKLSDSEIKHLQRKLKSKCPNSTVMYGQVELLGKAKMKVSSDNRTPAKVTGHAVKPLAKPVDERDRVPLTFDSRKLQLEVSDRITAYDYWELKTIHEQYRCKGKGTIVAVVDTGVDFRHPALHPIHDKIVAYRNFTGQTPDMHDEDGHGTACAGIACGTRFHAYTSPHSESSEQFDVPPGVAPHAKLVVCKVANGDTLSSEAIVEALEYIKNDHTGTCSHRVDVVSLSFGSSAYSEPIARAITDLVNVGVIVVCSASNDGHKFHTPICYPARLGHVLCIGSHGAHGKASLFSPIGQELDFLAPGENVVVPGNLEYQGEADSGDGTSYATPAVAGLICLILQCLRKTHRSKAEKFHNHWVMKELLREMSTNGGTHSNDRGFGALTPIRFFRQPERFVTSIEMDILKSEQ